VIEESRKRNKNENEKRKKNEEKDKKDTRDVTLSNKPQGCQDRNWNTDSQKGAMIMIL
jgi:hypothetical protein